MESFSPSASSAALLAPPHHAAWLAAQLRLAPARPAETLVQYVARRLLVAGNADPAPALRAQLAQVAETEGGEGVMGDLFDFEGYGSDGPDSATTQMLALESFSKSPYAALDPEDSVFASRTPSAEAPEPFFSGAVGDADAMVVDPAMLASSASAVPPNAADASPEPPLRTKRPQPAAKTSSSGAHRWADSRDKLNTILAVQRFSKSPTETSFTLSHLLSSFQTPPKVVSEWSDGSFVPPAGRVEVLNAVRENGKAAFFKAFVHDGVDTLQRWALGVSSSKTLDRANKEAELQVTAEPLLQVLDLLQFTIDLLRPTKIPKAVKKLSLNSQNSKVKSLAKRLVARWDDLQRAGTTSITAPVRIPTIATTTTVPPPSTQKLVDNRAAEKERELKKRKAESIAANSSVKKTKPAPVIPKIQPTNTAKNLFGGSKVALPSFQKAKKADSPVEPKLDAYRLAMLGTRPAPPAPPPVAAPPRLSTNILVASTSSLAQAGRSRTARTQRRVTFKPDAELATYREIPAREIPSGEDSDVHSVENASIRKEEGDALAHRQVLMEAEIAWVTPLTIIFPTQPDGGPIEEWISFHKPGAASFEKDHQQQREGSTAAVNFENADAPPSASEGIVGTGTASSGPAAILKLSTLLQNDMVVQQEILHAQNSDANNFIPPTHDELQNLLGTLDPAAMARYHGGMEWNQEKNGNGFGGGYGSQDPSHTQNRVSQARSSQWDLSSNPNFAQRNGAGYRSAPQQQQQQPDRERGRQRLADVPCRYYNTERGCTRNDCSFMHAR